MDHCGPFGSRIQGLQQLGRLMPGLPDFEDRQREPTNWGSKHTDTYAWGQVVGFDNAPDDSLECATVKLKIGPLWTPPLTFTVLRVEGVDYKVNALARAVRADGHWMFFDWNFDTEDPKQGLRIHGRIHANRADFVGLTDFNPPGGSMSACVPSGPAWPGLPVRNRARKH